MELLSISRDQIKGQEVIPGLEVKEPSLSEVILRMSPAERAEYKAKLAAEISDREELLHLINDVEGAEW